MKQIRIGVIGFGQRLQTVIRALREATDAVTFTAVYDPSEAAVAALRAELNPAAVAAPSVQALVAEDLDWVMIGSRNCDHAAQIVAALEAGHHVFCEKPLALSVEDCLRIRRVWQHSGRHFSLGFTLRYSPHYRKIREVIASGRLGKILSVECNEHLNFDHGGYIHADWRRKTAWAGSHLLKNAAMMSIY